jgi:hypothetical protein
MRVSSIRSSNALIVMTEPDYDRILEGLAAANRILIANRGELSGNDVRIRQLISAAEAETQRQRVEARRSSDGASRDVAADVV